MKTTRYNMRAARRIRCKSYLSTYLAANPGVVTQEVALRFLTHGHRDKDLKKFIDQARVSASVMQVPESIKEQARGMFRAIQQVRNWKKKVAKRLAEKKRQRAARRISRRAA